VFNQRSIEGQDIVLFCKSEGSVSWDKRSVGGRIQVFMVQDEEDTIVCKRDSDELSVLADFSLLIKKASVSDSGLYFCNDSPVVNLTVAPSQESSTNTCTTATSKRTTESSTNTQPFTTTT
ncbi:roundabout 2-like, partial [Clarias magur]